MTREFASWLPLTLSSPPSTIQTPSRGEYGAAGQAQDRLKAHFERHLTTTWALQE